MQKSISTTLFLALVSTVPNYLEAAPTFSVPGFVDETLYQGNGMISMRFDSTGRLWVAEKRGRILVFEPNPGGPSTFNYDYYETGELSQLPDFSTLTPVKSGVVSDFTLDPRERNDDFAFRFTGSTTIDTPGVYTYYLSSDDGSKLYIDDVLVVDNDGTHGAGEVSDTVALTAGVHDIRVEFFERAGGEELVVEYSGPGVAKGPVGQGAFKSPKVFADLASQVNTNGERGMTGLALDPDLANNRFVYVLFATGSDQRILRLTSDAAFDAMLPGSELILLSGLPNTNTVHKAGDIAFHPDDPNNLYVMLGDDGERYVVSDLTNYNGKLLKIGTSDGKGLPTNPFYIDDVNSVRSRIWAHSFRNPYRFTFDPDAPFADVIYVSENGDGEDRIARIEKGADGAWPDSDYLQDSSDGKRKILDISDPSKTGIEIIRSGPLAPDGNPVVYHARYGGGDRNEVRRWTLTGPDLDTLTPLPADGGNAFYSGFTEHGIVSFTAGPDGSLYYTDSGQGESASNSQRLGRIRFVGGTSPSADFATSVQAGQSPLVVDFTDASTAPDSSIASWSWDFGDGTQSTEQNPTHTFTEPGVYEVSLIVANTLGLTDEQTTTVTSYHATSLTLTGQIIDARTLAGVNFNTETQLRFYQADGTTPLPFSGGLGVDGNAATVSAGGAINLSLDVELTGPGVVISAGEDTPDGVQAAVVGSALSTSLSQQSASVSFRLSDTMLLGRSLDTLGEVAQVDIGVSRGSSGNYYSFVGGRDFLPSSGHSASGASHRTVPDALGYFHIPIPTGGGDTEIFFDTSADTLTTSHGKVLRNIAVPSGQATSFNFTIGLYDGGTDETDLSGIASTPNVDFETQIQPLFSNYCVACHNDIATNSGGLDLDPGAAFSELVSHESAEAPGVMLVAPGDPGRSYLMEKLNATVPQVGTSMRPGDPMPVEQRALIRDWIQQLVTSSSLEFTSSIFTVDEGTESTTANISIRRTGNLSNAISVTASTISGGSATEDSDYTSSTSVINWAANEDVVKTFTVPILTDQFAEGDETIFLQLSLPTGGAEIGSTGSATLTIKDQAFDSWRSLTFGALANSPEAQAGADFDKDGHSNLLEYALASDATEPNGPLVSIVSSGSGRLELSFNRRVDAPDVTYIAQASDALAEGSWVNLATKAGVADWTMEPGVSVSDEPGSGAVVVIDSELITGPPKRFVRLKVEQTP